jgi:heavy metal translocating P-type ATPase
MTEIAEPLEACDYCGLPVPRALWLQGGEAPQYCCFGCRFAAAVTGAQGEQGATNWVLVRLGLAAFLAMNVMVFTMALWTQDFYGPDTSALAHLLHGLFRYLAMLFALPVLVLLGGPLAENGWRGLRAGQLPTDLLLLLGIGASYLYSTISVIRDEGPVYFEIGCMVLLLVTIGRWLEATGKLRTTAAIKGLHRLLPERARVAQQDGDIEMPVEEVAAGSELRVLPGERVPCDGYVKTGTAAIDEQAMTGESRPVVKGPGTRVYGGSLNLDGDLRVTVTAPSWGGAVARMAELVSEAVRAKGQYERLADLVTAIFLPGVVVVAFSTLVWRAGQHGIVDGILAGLAVLLIACPCALGLATPMAVWAALGRAAQAQVLFRTGEVLERLASVRVVFLDKTGTLTTGTPEVAGLSVARFGEEREVMSRAACLASSSTHSYAMAIGRHAARSAAPNDGAVCDVRVEPGLGVTASFAGYNTPVYLGSHRLMEQAGLALGEGLKNAAEQALQDGRPLVFLGWDSEVRGIFRFREELRLEAPAAVDALRRRGLQVGVLSGDGAAHAAPVARELGVPIQAGLLPAEKVQEIARARQRVGPVAMVGDGINDAPALAASDVGIAIGCGTDVSRDSASVCLLGNDLRRLAWAIDLARQTRRVIKQNLFWAFAYNTAGIGVACTGQLSPIIASLAMVASSVLVLGNSLRLASHELSVDA